MANKEEEGEGGKDGDSEKEMKLQQKFSQEDHYFTCLVLKCISHIIF